MGGGGHRSQAPWPELFREVQAFTNAALILFFAELGGLLPVLLHCGPLEPPELGLPARLQAPWPPGRTIFSTPSQCPSHFPGENEQVSLASATCQPDDNFDFDLRAPPPPKIPSSANI